MDKLGVELRIIPGSLTLEQKRIIRKAVDMDDKIDSCGNLWRAVRLVRCAGVPSDCEECGLGSKKLKAKVQSWGNIFGREEKKKDKNYRLKLKKLRGRNG